MPTVLTHPAVPLALGLALGSRVVPPRLLLAGVLASVVPDLDVLSFKLGIAYEHALGHRGFSHSALFAVGLGLLACACARLLRCSPWAALGVVAFSALSHGLLDMLTTGGLGVALAWPWSDERWFAPWQVIRVSPIGLKPMLSERGLVVLLSELRWVWLPLLTAGLLVGVLRHGLARQQAPAAP
jgi:inner membrane protein